MYTQRSERNLRHTSEVESLLRVGHGNQTLVVRFIRKCLCLLSHLTDSTSSLLLKKKKKEEDTKNMTTVHCLFAKCLLADI